MKIGGIIAGHDFLSAHDAYKYSAGAQNWETCADGTKHPGAVKGAVVEFVCTHNLVLHHSRDKPPSWYTSRKTENNEFDSSVKVSFPAVGMY